MFLCKGQFIFGQGVRLKTGVNVALEGEHRLFSVIERKVGLPVHKSLVIQRRDILRNTHQGTNIIGTERARTVHQ